jgi:hypothetical protein
MTTSPPSARSPGHGDRLAGPAAADRHPEVEQDAGERAHPGAGDTHDVHTAEIGRAGIRSVAALRTSAAPGASQSSGRSPAWPAVVLMRRTAEAHYDLGPSAPAGAAKEADILRRGLCPHRRRRSI